MYINAITLRGGVRLAFTSELPLSVDKIKDGWNIVNDVTNGATINFKGEEVIHIGSQNLDKVGADDKAKKFTTGITKA